MLTTKAVILIVFGVGKLPQVGGDIQKAAELGIKTWETENGQEGLKA
ncbi:hypothetical protein ACFLUU_07680 [Chloroflexota bacterium]